MVILGVSFATSEQEPAHAIGPSGGPPGPVSNPEAGTPGRRPRRLGTALGIPDHDRMQRIVEHARDDFELPPASSDNFVLVEVTMFAGRSRQAKRRLYQELVRNLGELGVAPTDVLVLLHEPPMDNWGIRGGQMASEVELGFEVQV